MVDFRRKAPIRNRRSKIKRNLRLTRLGRLFGIKKYKA